MLLGLDLCLIGQIDVRDAKLLSQSWGPLFPLHGVLDGRSQKCFWGNKGKINCPKAALDVFIDAPLDADEALVTGQIVSDRVTPSQIFALKEGKHGSQGVPDSDQSESLGAGGVDCHHHHADVGVGRFTMAFVLRMTSYSFCRTGSLHILFVISFFQGALENLWFVDVVWDGWRWIENAKVLVV